MSYTAFQPPHSIQVVETERCTGHCCRRFFMAFSPAELKAKYDEWVRWGKPAGHDIAIVWPMLSYLGPSHITVYGVEREQVGHYYTCKHFDGKGCEIYDARPRMCSDYPYHDECRYKECTMKLEPIQGPIEAYVSPFKECGEPLAGKYAAADEEEITQSLADVAQQLGQELMEQKPLVQLRRVPKPGQEDAEECQDSQPLHEDAAGK